jgi:hypothetical protein
MQGKEVTWEWSLKKVWPEAWFKNPGTGLVEYGWTSSAEFTGRHLDEI